MYERSTSKFTIPSRGHRGIAAQNRQYQQHVFLFVDHVSFVVGNKKPPKNSSPNKLWKRQIHFCLHTSMLFGKKIYLYVLWFLYIYIHLILVPSIPFNFQTHLPSLHQHFTLRWMLKPMNCPGHFVMFDARVRSYKEIRNGGKLTMDDDCMVMLLWKPKIARQFMYVC